MHDHCLQEPKHPPLRIFRAIHINIQYWTFIIQYSKPSSDPERVDEGFSGARGGGRTRTLLSVNKILSLACLPIPPPGQEYQCAVCSVQWAVGATALQTSLVKGTAKKIHPLEADGCCGAEDEIRTRDPHLGKVMLYQLSYFRVC